VLFLFTSNVPDLIDPALLRRIGGAVVRFGRLDRVGFQAVLDKHLHGLPLRPGAKRTALVAELATWLFAANADPGQVEITLAGSTTPLRKHRRDLLTGALIDRAVQQAAAMACHGQLDGAAAGGDGIDGPLLARCLDHQVQAVLDLLAPHNAHDHLELPDGARVVATRRGRAGVPRPGELRRVASF
jgi:hypothetical protein